MKKKITCLMLVTLIALAAVGCGSKGYKTDTPDSQISLVAEGTPVDLTKQTIIIGGKSITKDFDIDSTINNFGNGLTFSNEDVYVTYVDSAIPIADFDNAKDLLAPLSDKDLKETTNEFGKPVYYSSTAENKNIYVIEDIGGDTWMCVYVSVFTPADVDDILQTYCFV